MAMRCDPLDTRFARGRVLASMAVAHRRALARPQRAGSRSRVATNALWSRLGAGTGQRANAQQSELSCHFWARTTCACNRGAVVICCCPIMEMEQ